MNANSSNRSHKSLTPKRLRGVEYEDKPLSKEERHTLIVVWLLTLVNLLIALLSVYGVPKNPMREISHVLYAWRKSILELADMTFHINVGVSWTLLEILVLSVSLLTLLVLVVRLNRT